MRRLVKILFVLLVVVVILVTAAVILVPRFLEVDRYRSTLEKMASERLGREVTLGELSLDLLPGARLRVGGIEVAATEQEGAGESVLRAREVEVGVDLWALLGKEVRVTWITLHEPEILLYRSPEGTWNVEEIAPGEGTAAGGRPARVKVDRVAVRSGTVRVRDEARGLTAEFRDLDLDVRSPGADPRYGVALGVRLPGGGRLEWKGKVGTRARPGPAALAGEVDLEEVALDSLAPWIEESSGLSPAGTLSGSLVLVLESWGEGRLELRGGLEARAFQLRPRMKRPMDFSLELEGATIALDGSEADLPRVSLASGGVRLAGAAEWARGPEGVSWRAKLEPSTIHPAELRRALSDLGLEATLEGIGAEPFSLSGTVGFEAGAAGARRVEARDLKLDGIHLVLKRDEGGALQLPGVGAGKKPRAGKTPLGFRVHGLSVENARLRFTDRAVEPDVRWELRDLRASVDSWGEGGETTLELKAALAGEGGGSISLAGTFGPARGERLPLDLSVEGSLPTSLIAPYLGGGLQLSGGKATLRLDTLRGDWKRALDLSGSLALEGVTARLSGAAKPLPLDLEATFKGRLLEEGKGLDLERLAIELPGSSVVVGGGLRKEEAGTSIQARLLEPARLTGEDLEGLMALAGPALPVTLKTRKPMTVEGSFQRTAAGATRVEGDLRLQETEVHLARLREPLVVSSARVKATGRRADVELEGGRIGRSDLRGRFTVKDFDSPSVEFEVSSRRAELSELLSYLQKKEKEEAAAGVARRPAPEDDVVARMHARGTLRIEEGTFETLAFQDFSTTLTVDGYRTAFDPLSLRLYGGRMEGWVRFDTKGEEPGYAFHGRLNGVDVNALLSANTQFRDGLSGEASGRFDLAGHGAGVDAVVKNLEGTGDLRVLDGRIAGMDIFDKMAGVTGLFGEKSLSRLSRKLAREGTEFSELSGTYQVSNGVLATSDLRLVSPEATITAKGTVRLLGGGMDLAARVIFSEEMSLAMREEGSEAAKIFWDNRRGRVVFPAHVGGTVREPKVTPEGGSIVEQLVRHEAEKKIGDLLGDILGGKKPTEEERTEAQPPRRAAPPDPPARPRGTGPRVTVRSHRLSGNFLRPDLRFEGVFEGRDLAGADLEIRDEKGNVVFQRRDAFPEIAAWQRANPGARRASIPFSRKVEDRDLGSASRWQVKVTLRDRAGGTHAATFSEERGLKQLF